MKKIFYLLLIMMSMTVSSCKKFLDVKPADFLAPINYYTTAVELQTAVNGIYNILTHASLYRSGIVYLNGFEGDEAYNNRATLINYPFTFDYTATNPTIESFWYGCYIGIGRANALLKNIDNNPDLAIALRNKARGEALFLRGYYYFLLAQNFGGVPLLLNPVTSAEDTEAPRATLKETYDQVLQDMEKAEAFVDDINISTSSKISKSAVRGIMARVCLSMAGAPLNDVTKYEAARKWAKAVIDDGVAGHRLNPSYADIFIKIARDEYDPKETIWEAEFWGNGTDAFGLAGNNGRILGPASTNANTGICPAYVNITGKLYDAYTPGDRRMFWCIPNFSYNSSGARGAKTYTAPPTRGDVYLKNVGKYRREYEVALPQSSTSSPQNWPILRYADVLLMYAEAVNQISGPTAEAVNAVNLVRRRAWSKGIKEVVITNGGTGYTTAPIVSFSGGGNAEATATVSGGKVTAIIFKPDAVIGALTGTYNSAPAITLTGGSGSGATATVAIYTEADANVPATATASKESFLGFIQQERFRELNQEGIRKGDLIRWGIFVSAMHQVRDMVMQDVGSPFYLQRFRDVTERHNVWPIPTKELTLNRAMVQNPGWE